MTKTSLVLDTTTVEFLDGSGGQVILTQDEAALVANSSFYAIAIDPALAMGATFSVLVRTTAPETNIKPSIVMGGEGLAEMFENSIISVDGTSIPVLARNRINPPLSATSMFTGPTITDPGDSLGSFLIDSGGNKNVPPAETSFPLQWVLGPGDYLLQVTNNSTGPLAVQAMGAFFERF